MGAGWCRAPRQGVASGSMRGLHTSRRRRCPVPLACSRMSGVPSWRSSPSSKRSTSSASWRRQRCAGHCWAAGHQGFMCGSAVCISPHPPSSSPAPPRLAAACLPGGELCAGAAAAPAGHAARRLHSAGAQRDGAQPGGSVQAVSCPLRALRPLRPTRMCPAEAACKRPLCLAAALARSAPGRARLPSLLPPLPA